MKLKVLLQHAWPYRWSLALLATLTTVSSLITLAIPWFAGQLLGGIVAGASGAQGGVAGLLVASLVVSALLSGAVAFQSAKTAAKLLADIRQRIFDHVQRLPIGFHESRGRGDTLALLTYEVARLSLFLTGTVVGFPSRLLTTIGAIVLMFRIDPRLAMIVPILIPAFYLILKIVGRRLRSLAISIQRAEARVVAIAEEMLEMVPATKAFTRELSEAERYQAAVADASALTIRQGQIYAALEPLIGLLAALAAVTVVLFAARGVETGNMSPQQLFSFIFYAALLTRPVSQLAQIYGEVQTVRGTLARMQSVLDQPTEVFTPVSPPSRRVRGDVRFDGVEFAYPGRESVLQGVSFHIAPGETVALIGLNGSGKTAIINLLLRYYERDAGLITLDGVDVATLGVGELRRNIGLVPQVPMLFNASIADNIGFGAENASAKAIEKAARLAQAHGFIEALPAKWETVIGDRGVRLSGGQRQRIALARALIKDPPILIFDEATSMFDAEGEEAFIAESADALKGRTVILVTHRPATLALAQRVLALEDGVIHELDAASAGRAMAHV